MGSTSSTRISVKQAPVTGSSNTAATYPTPAPPRYILDDIKVPIRYYDQDNLFESDGFDWNEILKPDKNEQPVTTRKNRITAHLNQAADSFPDTAVDKTNHVTKQAPPSVKRPIRSITLHGRDRGAQVTRQRSFTPHRSPNLSRKSTPAGFNVESKIDFKDIDKHAKGATKTHRQSYDTLLQYLQEPVRSGVFPEIKTARALLVWLAYQPLKKSGSRSDTSTPVGLVNAVTNGAETFSSAYVILCRYAGLPCALIEGISKSFTFIPTVSPTVDDQWTAVYCEGSWQIVHTDIVCKSVKSMDEDKFENVHLKLARLNMVSLNHGNDRKLLIAAIEKCRKLNISHDDSDVFNAEKWCEFLKHKTDLNDSLHRRNISFLDTTLRNVSCYRYKAIFHTKISRLFHLRHQLVEIRSLQKFEPYLQQATHELAGVDQPPRPVHVTMAAVLLIFGETDKKIEDWSYIKKHLQRESDLVDPPLIRKIQFITEVCPIKSDSRKIITLLQEHKVVEIQEANPWTVYFHLWAVKVMSILEDTDPNNIGDFPEFLDFSQLNIEPLSQNGQTNSDSNRDGRNSQTGPRSRVSQHPDSTAMRVRSGPDQMAFRTAFDQQRHSALRSASRNDADAQTDSRTFDSQNKEHYEDERDADQIGNDDQDREDETFVRRQRTDIGIQTD